jgi:hypothetical protein
VGRLIAVSSELIDTQNSHDGGAAPAPEIESIWLTRTSVKPLWLAVAMGLTLVGLFSFLPLLIGGIIAVIAITISWIGDSREESDELPLN